MIATLMAAYGWKYFQLTWDIGYSNCLLPIFQGYFKKLLCCATEEAPMVIFLDSLDQISGADGAHSLMWLPTKLPPYVKFVVSSLPQLYGVLDNLFKIIPSRENRIEITPLGRCIIAI